LSEEEVDDVEDDCSTVDEDLSGEGELVVSWVERPGCAEGCGEDADDAECWILLDLVVLKCISFSPLNAMLNPNLCPPFLFRIKTITFDALHIMKRTIKTSDTGTSGRADGGLPSCWYGELYGAPCAMIPA
jgi:hypothetical protein